MPTILAAPGHNGAPQEPHSNSSGWNYEGPDQGDHRNTSSELCNSYDDADANHTNFDGIYENYEDYEEGEIEEEEDLDPQEAYYAALLQRFAAFRALLRNRPAQITSGTVQSGQDLLNAVTARWAKQGKWSYALRFHPPTASHIASLRQPAVMLGLERVAKALSRAALLAPDKQGQTLGAWAWALLGACRERGELGSEEIASVRLLGKAASRMREKLRASSVNKRTVSFGNGSSVIGEEDEIEIEQEVAMGRDAEEASESGPSQATQPSLERAGTSMADVQPSQEVNDQGDDQMMRTDDNQNPVHDSYIHQQADAESIEIELGEVADDIHDSRKSQNLDDNMAHHGNLRKVEDIAGTKTGNIREIQEQAVQLNRDSDVKDDPVQLELARRRAYLQKLQEAASRPSNKADSNGANEEPLKSAPHKPSAAPTSNSDEDAIKEAIQLELAKRRALFTALVGDNPDKSEASEATRPRTSSSNKSQSLPLEDKGGSVTNHRTEGKDEAVADALELKKRAFATLDIIITIVGEVFGQRDLLDSREVWGEYD